MVDWYRLVFAFQYVLYFHFYISAKQFHKHFDFKYNVEAIPKSSKYVQRKVVKYMVFDVLYLKSCNFAIFTVWNWQMAKTLYLPKQKQIAFEP